jgi:hypothetical protein
MKFLSLLSLIALVSSAAFLLGLTFDVQALPLFGVTTVALLLLIAGKDYASTPGSSRRPFRRKHELPFAA